MKELNAVKIDNNHYQVDMRGWMCPYPKYAVGILLRKLPPASIMDLLVDCPAATKDVPEAVRQMGCSVQEVLPIGDGEWRIRISK